MPAQTLTQAHTLTLAQTLTLDVFSCMQVQHSEGFANYQLKLWFVVCGTALWYGVSSEPWCCSPARRCSAARDLRTHWSMQACHRQCRPRT